MDRMMTRRLSTEAHLWLERLDRELLEAGHPELSGDERQRAADIRHLGARRQFLAGRVLARQVLSHYAPVAPGDWRFEATDEGRPEISAPDIGTRQRFNLSHSGNLVACLVTDELDCGVDVENRNRQVNERGIAAHSFTAEERADLEAPAPGARPSRFFELWTLKEAYLKARGSGIRLRLDAVSFQLSGNCIRHQVTGADSGENDAWRFWLLRPDDSHLLAVSVRVGRSADYSLTSWELDDRLRGRRLDLPTLGTTPGPES